MSNPIKISPSILSADFSELKSDIQMYIDSDKDIIDSNLKVAYCKEKVDFLEAIIRTLNLRSYQINNAINWEKFKVGI